MSFLADASGSDWGTRLRSLGLGCWLLALVLVGCSPSSPENASGGIEPVPNEQVTDPPPIDDSPAPKTPAERGAASDQTFDDLKFDIEPDAPFDRSMLTDTIRELDETRIRIRGYILPTEQKRGIQQFVLVRDNQECCFGPGAALYDCILVTMEKGKSTEFSIRPVAVEGEFTVDEFYYDPDEPPLAIFRLQGESVE